MWESQPLGTNLQTAAPSDDNSSEMRPVGLQSYFCFLLHDRFLQSSGTVLTPCVRLVTSESCDMFWMAKRFVKESTGWCTWDAYASCWTLNTSHLVRHYLWGQSEWTCVAGQWTSAWCTEAAWQTARVDKLDRDRDKCVKAEWHKHKKVISTLWQPKAYEVSLYRVSIRRSYL